MISQDFACIYNKVAFLTWPIISFSGIVAGNSVYTSKDCAIFAKCFHKLLKLMQCFCFYSLRLDYTTQMQHETLFQDGLFHENAHENTLVL